MQTLGTTEPCDSLNQRPPGNQVSAPPCPQVGKSWEQLCPGFPLASGCGGGASSPGPHPWPTAGEAVMVAYSPCEVRVSNTGESVLI